MPKFDSWRGHLLGAGLERAAAKPPRLRSASRAMERRVRHPTGVDPLNPLHDLAGRSRSPTADRRLAHSAERSCYFRDATFKTTSREAKAASSAQPNGCGLLGGRGDGSHQTRYRHYEPAEPDGSCIRRSRSSNAYQAAPDRYRQRAGDRALSPRRLATTSRNPRRTLATNGLVLDAKSTESIEQKGQRT